ncbi:hypothetical protein I6A84_29940 [Frankia sp. CNm7]|uniref:Uncharacterized protein n=1 Tax=Frankia nepalensis TaxID=1836974 RepID=A0A937RP04_9ACTN|nr:hypothetical protein [Frankia nepalensis]MBL7495057.1 hypothetical protein [Frankia nepalensis]MBL7515241.1 hypothetical protein [Frankia nepalensis]MBL7522185.1 hypothetical protein [Frankia nepalensis]MBL7632299.1 hypothetical protein [Frankia nepalensis]
MDDTECPADLGSRPGARIRRGHAPAKPVPAGGGLNFRCDGKAVPLTSAVCVRGTMRTQLGADGQPTLPYRAVGATPIED